MYAFEKILILTENTPTVRGSPKGRVQLKGRILLSSIQSIVSSKYGKPPTALLTTPVTICLVILSLSAKD